MERDDFAFIISRTKPCTVKIETLKFKENFAIGLKATEYWMLVIRTFVKGFMQEIITTTITVGTNDHLVNIHLHQGVFPNIKIYSSYFQIKVDALSWWSQLSITKQLIVLLKDKSTNEKWHKNYN